MLITYKMPEVGKVQEAARSATSAISVFAEVALHLNLKFWSIAEVALRTKIFKFYRALVALRFQ